MSDAKKRCALCHKCLDEEDVSDVSDDEEKEDAPSQDWCIVIQRENDDLVLSLREFKRDAP